MLGASSRWPRGRPGLTGGHPAVWITWQVLQHITEYDKNQTVVDHSELRPGFQCFIYEPSTRQYTPLTIPDDYDPTDLTFDKLKDYELLKVPPQSLIVIGGGPTGLITTLHNLENVLLSRGTMRLLESRDAFTQWGATFERAQIVRLDARWIGMLRYHLGTIYEDLWIPASGETDPHYGNTLPTQGFIEITIKDLEAAIHLQIAKCASRQLLQHDTNAKAQYDPEANTLSKNGLHLKKKDLVLWNVDNNGTKSDLGMKASAGVRRSNDQDEDAGLFSWRVVDLRTDPSMRKLDADELQLRSEYSIYLGKRQALFPYRLMSVDLVTETYGFIAIDPEKHKTVDLVIKKVALPYIYMPAVKRAFDWTSIVLQCELPGDDGQFVTREIPVEEAKSMTFRLDIGHSHVCEAIGKVHAPPIH